MTPRLHSKNNNKTMKLLNTETTRNTYWYIEIKNDETKLLRVNMINPANIN